MFKTSGLLDLFFAEEIDALVEQRANIQTPSQLTSESLENLAALDVALAIGAQYMTHAGTNTQIETDLFARARQVAL